MIMPNVVCKTKQRMSFCSFVREKEEEGKRAWGGKGGGGGVGGSLKGGGGGSRTEKMQGKGRKVWKT